MKIPQHKKDVERWLKRVRICNTIYTISDDMTIDVNGDVVLSHIQLCHLPFKFGKVAGMFACSNCKLRSPENFPDYIGGKLYCGYNKFVVIPELIPNFLDTIKTHRDFFKEIINPNMEMVSLQKLLWEV